MNIQNLKPASELAQRFGVKALVYGGPGICDLCGEDMPRLINGVCAPCRDRFKLP